MNWNSKRGFAKGLRMGAKLLESGKWTKRMYKNNEGAFCALGACQQVTGVFYPFCASGPNIANELVNFNDTASSKESVIRRMRQVARELEHGGGLQ